LRPQQTAAQTGHKKDPMSRISLINTPTATRILAVIPACIPAVIPVHILVIVLVRPLANIQVCVLTAVLTHPLAVIPIPVLTINLVAFLMVIPVWAPQHATLLNRRAKGEIQKYTSPPLPTPM